MAEVRRYSLSALPGHHRSLMRNRLQMGSTRTSDARETDSMREAIGVDLYNQCVTGKVAKTLNSIKSDADHVPCVLIANSSGGIAIVISKSDRPVDGK